MAYYPPPPSDNDPMPPHAQHHPQNACRQNDTKRHHQPMPMHQYPNNRDNIGWNDDNVLLGYNRPLGNTNMNEKHNHHCSQQRSDIPSNNYSNDNDGPPYSQRNDNHNHHRVGRGDHSNTVNKRAAKRRVKHDLPGPAGNWFRQKKQQKSVVVVAVANRKGSASSTNAVNAQESGKKQQSNNNNNNNSNDAMTKTEYNGEQQSLKNEDRTPTASSSSSPHNNNNVKTKQDEQLFHDHSSDLHECNAWNLMCTTLNRIVPPANLLLHNHHHSHPHHPHQPGNAYTTYKSTLRKSIPNNYALIQDIHEGRYDTCHLDKTLYSTDLRIPLLVGYVASVQCHAHSDWTVLLVDELYSVVKYCTNNGGGNNGSSSSSSSGMNSSSSSSSNAGRGILCWIEERLVKQHANWVRPGVVWMIEGARLALFSSIEEDDDDVNVDMYNNNNSGSTAAAATTAMSTTAVVDVSPSTDNSRGGGSIDRMILVGESSLVYAWTPEEASSTFTHQEFSDLMERRCDLGLHGDELPDDEEEDENEEVTNVDCTSSKSEVKKKNDYYDADDDVLIVEETNAQTVEIIDVDVSNKKAAAEEQVLEACSAANDGTHTESHTEVAKCIPQVVDDEPKDVTQPPVNKNLPNPYAKKDFSQVTPSEETKSQLPHVENLPKEDEMIDSSVQVQSKETRLPTAESKVLGDITCETKDSGQSSPTRSTTLDNALNAKRQPADGPDQQIQLDIDDSFDDMLDEDSLDEVTPRKNKRDHTNVLNSNTSTTGGESFDDMLDEDSDDRETPHNKEEGTKGKLESKMSTPGGDSFDDMLDEDSLDVDTPYGGKLGSKMDTPGGDSFDDLLCDDSDDNIEAMFQTRNPQPTSDNNLFSPSQGVSVLDKDDLADLGDEDDDDF